MLEGPRKLPYMVLRVSPGRCDRGRAKIRAKESPRRNLRGVNTYPLFRKSGPEFTVIRISLGPISFIWLVRKKSNSYTERGKVKIHQQPHEDEA